MTLGDQLVTRTDLTVVPYEDRLRRQLISVWERSVRAAHEFLLPGDLEYSKRSLRI